LKLKPQELPGHLKQTLAPLYLVFGEEPLQINEATDAIRAAARERGYTERQVLTADSGFDWNRLIQASRSLSLFGSRQVLDLRLPGSPGNAGSKALQAYATAPPDTCLLLMTAGKLDAQSQKAEWFGALARAGVVVPVWPVEARELPQWVTARMRSRRLKPDAEAAALLAERVEGNLLAAAQEIEKLALLHGTGEVSADEVLASVSDSSRYDVFDLVDSALQGDAARVSRVLAGLRAEGVEPPLVLWALARELRSLAAMGYDLDNGILVEQVMSRVRANRRALVKLGLKRHKLGSLHRLLRQAARCDQVIKGAQPGQPWDELLSMSLALAGVRRDLSHP
jgi:DNA polymerase III subunit delta